MSAIYDFTRQVVIEDNSQHQPSAIVVALTAEGGIVPAIKHYNKEVFAKLAG